MKANELRVGNWVNDESGAIPYQIRPQDFLPLSLPENEGKAKPITLTAEILVKAGFEEIYKSQMHTTFYKDKVNYYFWHQTARQYADFMGNQYDNIQNVHQLQNLYFALTGKELNIEL
jgi:hypothetical protein